MSRSLEGALTGLVVGDALAMPAHWYYQTENLRRDLGEVKEMLAPSRNHPESMLGGMTYDGTMDILHDKAALYANVSAGCIARGQKAAAGVLRDSHGNAIALDGQQPVHYHASLARGQNTANICIARLLMRYLGAAHCGSGQKLDYEGYDPERFLLDWFEAYMTTPPPPDAAAADPGQLVNHNDTYLDMYLRKYFEQRSQGTSALRVARRQREQWSIGSLDGVVMALPVILARAKIDAEAVLVARAVEHAKLTHDSISVFAVLAVVAPLLQQLLIGAADPDAALRAAGSKFNLPLISGDALIQSYREAKGPGNIPKAAKWAQHHTYAAQTITEALDAGLLERPPLEVCGEKRLSSACYTEHSLPIVLYLALRYKDDFRGALEANVAIGGHSTARGALLGCIMGARVGLEGIPESWVSGLAAPDAVQADVAGVLRYTAAAAAMCSS